MNPKLNEAVDIFKQLGWEGATPENIMSLPLGTVEQKKNALIGLKNGDFGEFAQVDSNSYAYRSFIDVDETILALFAIRIGVDARRAVSILRNTNSQLIVDVIKSRGYKYACDFIKYACVSRRRIWEHSASVFGNVAVFLVYKMNLDIPQNVEYIKDWSAYTASAMGLKSEINRRVTYMPDLELIKQRFLEHITTGIAVNAAATGPFSNVFLTGVKLDLFTREKAIPLVFSALDASVRPGDRKVWVDILEQLEISNEELCDRIQLLIPIMASGDAAIITKLAPRLIAQAESAILVELLISTFSVTTKKAQQIVLKSALEKNKPDDVENIIPWLSVFYNSTDKTISSLANKLIKKWNIEIEQEIKEDNILQELWKVTPNVWKVPKFEIGEISPHILTQHLANIISRVGSVHDIYTEQFLAVANVVAYQSSEDAKTSLRGLKNKEGFLRFIICWVNGEKPSYGFDRINEYNKKLQIEEPLNARDYIVCLNLGKIPCLLSTPSKIDLSITISDLIERLELYKQKKIDVLEADLFLALTRLEIFCLIM